MSDKENNNSTTEQAEIEKTNDYIAAEVEYLLDKNKMVQRKLDKINQRMFKELGLEIEDE